MMKFSLIMSTLNRTEQLLRFLQHLEQQTFLDFELIIVDQNKDGRLDTMINAFQDKFPIKHLHSPIGVSLGRNIGIQHISGELVAFPDDDCWYERDLLQKVTELFAEYKNVDIITGRTVNSEGKTSLGKFDKYPGEITYSNAFKRGNTNTFFFRREVVQAISFDETLGPGAGTKWGCGEETDYILQALKAGYHLYYFPDLTVFHEDPILEYNEKAIQRGYAYGCGMGRVLKKHRYSFSFVFVKLFYQLGGIVVGLLQGDLQRVLYHWAVLKGRFEGWRSIVHDQCPTKEQAL